METVIFISFLLIFTLMIISNVKVEIYDNFNGTIRNIKTKKFACSICLKTDDEHTCVIYKDTTCFDNTIYAINIHTRCSLTKRILEQKNQRQFILDTPIGTKVKWHKHSHNNECIEDIYNTKN